MNVGLSPTPANRYKELIEAFSCSPSSAKQMNTKNTKNYKKNTKKTPQQHLLHGFFCNYWYTSPSLLYFFIAAQIAQGTCSIWIALVEQLEQSGQQ